MLVTFLSHSQQSVGSARKNLIVKSEGVRWGQRPLPLSANDDARQSLLKNQPVVGPADFGWDRYSPQCRSCRLLCRRMPITAFSLERPYSISHTLADLFPDNPDDLGLGIKPGQPIPPAHTQAVVHLYQILCVIVVESASKVRDTRHAVCKCVYPRAAVGLFDV